MLFDALIGRTKGIRMDQLGTALRSVPWISSHSYSELSEDAELDATDENVKSYLATRRSDFSPVRIKRLLWCSVALVLVISIAVTSVVYTVNRPLLEDGETPYSNNGRECGTSADEARAKGCRFEPMLSAWVPAPCHFPEFVTEYEDALGDMHTDWPWWWDRDLTVRVTEDEIPLMQVGNYSAIYTDYDHSHGLHCLYCWRKLTHAIEHGYHLIDNRCHQFYHAKHCAQHIAERIVKPHVGREKWAYPLMYHDCVAITSTHQTKPPE